jgi:hypothetical protein
MSGHKRTTVSLNEIDLKRLEGVEDRLKYVEKDYQSIRERVKSTQDQELREDWQRMQERQAAIQEALASTVTGFYGDLQNVEQQTSGILLEQAQEFQAQLSELSSGLYERTADIFENQRIEFVNYIENTLKARDYHWDVLREEILLDKQKAADYTRQVLENTMNLFHVISELLPIERYYPGLITQLEHELNNAYENLNLGFIEAGLVTGQRIEQELSKIRLEIGVKEMRRNALLTSVKRRLQEDVQIAEQQIKVSAIGLDGEDLNYEIDVPFWSGGRYSHSIGKLKGLLYQIENQGDFMSEEELLDLQVERIKRFEGNIQEAIYWARKNVLASQVRFNIASCVVQALEQQGFILTNGYYEEKDQRGAYQVLLKHIDGSEVAVQVSELDGEIGSNLIDLQTQNPELRSEHELRQRAREVASSLASYGLQVGKTKPLDLSTYHLPIEAPENSYQVSEKQVKYGRN